MNSVIGWGRPYWGLGYATEAARTITGFAFEALDVPFLWAGWFHDNPASGHVLAKLERATMAAACATAWPAA